MDFGAGGTPRLIAQQTQHERKRENGDGRPPLEHARITSARDRYQLLKTTFSLAAHDPCSLLLLQAKGRCLFRITQQQLDERFPGLYLHSLRRMEVEIDGLIPACGVTGGVRPANNNQKWITT